MAKQFIRLTILSIFKFSAFLCFIYKKPENHLLVEVLHFNCCTVKFCIKPLSDHQYITASVSTNTVEMVVYWDIYLNMTCNREMSAKSIKLHVKFLMCIDSYAPNPLDLLSSTTDKIMMPICSGQDIKLVAVQ